MYEIFLHLTGLSLVETLFYFYYIGPMETTIFENSVQTALTNSKYEQLTDDANHPIYILNPFNSSDLILIEQKEEEIYSEEFQDLVNSAEAERIHSNIVLFHKALKYWSIICCVSILICVIEMYIKYIIFLKKQKYDSISIDTNNIELKNMNIIAEQKSCETINELLTSTQDASYVNDNMKDDKFIDLIKLRKTLLHNTIHYSCLVLLILLFEYWFFNTIILKYNVFSIEKLEYLIYQNLRSIVGGYIDRHFKLTNN